MDNVRPQNVRISILGGLIEEISANGDNTLVTISYSNCPACNQRDKQIVLVVGNRTLIYDEEGNRILPENLKRGMLINAVFSSTMTRSIPPQANAYRIRVVRRPENEGITEGRIIDIDRQDRSFTLLSNSDATTILRVVVPESAVIKDIFGRQIPFSNLVAGVRVRVRHAAYMTASLPPQTTAYEVQIIR